MVFRNNINNKCADHNISSKYAVLQHNRIMYISAAIRNYNMTVIVS